MRYHKNSFYDHYMQLILEGAPSWETEIDANEILLIFDFDETIAKTSARIYVFDTEGNVVKKLSNEEFNTYQLQPGEILNNDSFKEFSDTELFFKKSVPIPYTLKIIEDAVMNGYELAVVTARSAPQIETAIRKYVLHFFPSAKLYKENVIAINSPSRKFSAKSTHDKKVEAFNKLVFDGDRLKYKGVEFFDDSLPNINAFEQWAKSIQAQYPFFKYYSKHIKKTIVKDNVALTQGYDGPSKLNDALKNKEITLPSEKPENPYLNKSFKDKNKMKSVHEIIDDFLQNNPDYDFYNMSMLTHTIEFKNRKNNSIKTVEF